MGLYFTFQYINPYFVFLIITILSRKLSAETVNEWEHFKFSLRNPQIVVIYKKTNFVQQFDFNFAFFGVWSLKKIYKINIET